MFQGASPPVKLASRAAGAHQAQGAWMLWKGHTVLCRNPSPGPFSWKISIYWRASRLCLVAGPSEMGALRGQGMYFPTCSHGD